MEDNALMTDLLQFFCGRPGLQLNPGMWQFFHFPWFTAHLFSYGGNQTKQHHTHKNKQTTNMIIYNFFVEASQSVVPFLQESRSKAVIPHIHLSYHNKKTLFYLLYTPMCILPTADKIADKLTSHSCMCPANTSKLTFLGSSSLGHYTSLLKPNHILYLLFTEKNCTLISY